MFLWSRARRTHAVRSAAKGLAALGERRPRGLTGHDLTLPWALVTLPRSRIVAGSGSMPGWRGLAASLVLLLLTAFAAVPEAQPAGDPSATAPPFGHEFRARRVRVAGNRRRRTGRSCHQATASVNTDDAPTFPAYRATQSRRLGPAAGDGAVRACLRQAARRRTREGRHGDLPGRRLRVGQDDGAAPHDARASPGRCHHLRRHVRRSCRGLAADPAGAQPGLRDQRRLRPCRGPTASTWQRPGAGRADGG